MRLIHGFSTHSFYPEQKFQLMQRTCKQYNQTELIKNINLRQFSIANKTNNYLIHFITLLVQLIRLLTFDRRSNKGKMKKVILLFMFRFNYRHIHSDITMCV